MTRPPGPHDHIRIEGCYRCVWPDGSQTQPSAEGEWPVDGRLATLLASMVVRNWNEMTLEEADAVRVRMGSMNMPKTASGVLDQVIDSLLKERGQRR